MNDGWMILGWEHLLDCDVPPDSQRHRERYRNRVEDLREIAVEQQVRRPTVA